MIDSPALVESAATLVGQGTLLELSSVARNTPYGPLIEVGVYHGGSAQWLYALSLLQRRPLYLFDTFCGIPHRSEWDEHKIGDFGDGPTAEQIQDLFPFAHVIEGVFPQSAERMDLEGIAFAHLDVDQYQSYKESLEYLFPRMLSGGIIWLDDYGCLAGANLAVDEFLLARRMHMYMAPSCRKFYIKVP